jgi:molybdenum cofactor cytidylyltransferase
VLPALILAAGASSRMGRTKALLPLPGGWTFLGRLDATLREAGIQDVVAVIAHDADAIQAAAATAGLRLRFTRNPDPSRGQLSSLLAGVEALPRGPVLVTPVDLPLVSPQTVGAVIDAWQRTNAPIVRPARGGRHGHPVIFAASILDELRRADLEAGARPIVQSHLHEIVNVSVDDDGAFDDIDTPEDYARLVGRSLTTRLLEAIEEAEGDKRRG